MAFTWQQAAEKSAINSGPSNFDVNRVQQMLAKME